jgi:hypothetical protein
MADYYIDIKHLHKDTAVELMTTLRGRYKQWGFEEDDNRIVVVDSVGSFFWFYPRIDDNIALLGGHVSNDGSDTGIKLDNTGALKLVGDDHESGSYDHGSTGNYKILLLDKDGYVVVGTADVAKSVS